MGILNEHRLLESFLSWASEAECRILMFVAVMIIVIIRRIFGIPITFILMITITITLVIVEDPYLDVGFRAAT